MRFFNNLNIWPVSLGSIKADPFAFSDAVSFYFEEMEVHLLSKFSIQLSFFYDLNVNLFNFKT